MPETAEEKATREAAEQEERGTRRHASGDGKDRAQRLLSRTKGNALEAIGRMFDENNKAREERRKAVEQLAEFTAPGVIVLKADDAKAYTAYVALGKPDDLKKALDELPGLRTKVTDGETRTAATEAAKLLKWNADATASMVLDKKLTLSFVDGKDKDGKAIKVPHVKPVGADEKVAAVPLADWQTANASYLTPALAAAAANGTGAHGAATGSQTGTQFVEQGGAGAGAAGAGGGTPAAKPIPGRATYMTPGQRAAADKK